MNVFQQNLDLIGYFLKKKQYALGEKYLFSSQFKKKWDGPRQGVAQGRVYLPIDHYASKG